MRVRYLGPWILLLAIAGCAGGGGGEGACRSGADCPPGQYCVDGRCVSTDGGPDDAAVPDLADGDAGEGADADADGADADAEVATRRTFVGPTSGGGHLSSEGYQLMLSIGTPQPMGANRGGSRSLRVGPAAGMSP